MAGNRRVKRLGDSLDKALLENYISIRQKHEALADAIICSNDFIMRHPFHYPVLFKQCLDQIWLAYCERN